MEQKSNKVLVWIIVILTTLVLGFGGYILYDKVVSKDFIKNDNKTTAEEESKENNAIIEKSTEDLYKEYLSNLEKNIKNNYLDKEEEHLYNCQYVFTGIEEEIYSVSINKNLELHLSYYGKKSSQFNNYKISENVISFFIIENGNGGMRSLYYIKNDGTLYSATVEGIEDEVQTKKINRKNIVSVISGTKGDAYSGAAIPVFIDIEGNMFFGE